MSLYNSFDRNLHFSELNSPLQTAAGNLTPDQRKALARANLESLTGTAAITGAITTAATTTAVYKQLSATDFRATLTLTDFAVGTGADNAALGIGANFWSLPAGVHMIRSAFGSGNFKCGALLYTNTLDAGIGTVVASGAVSVLGGTATFENVIGGVASAALSTTVGGAWAASTLTGAGGTPNLLIASAASHDLFLNAAGTWTDIAAAGAVTFTGTLVIDWTKIS